MRKYKYYVVNVVENVAVGVNDADLARQLADDSDNYVIDIEKDVLIQENGDEDPIGEDDGDRTP